MTAVVLQTAWLLALCWAVAEAFTRLSRRRPKPPPANRAWREVHAQETLLAWVLEAHRSDPIPRAPRPGSGEAEGPR